MNSRSKIIFFLGVFILAGLIELLFAEAITRPNVQYTADSLRDPFEGYTMEEETTEGPPTEAEVEAPLPLPALNIQGLIWGGSIPQAIINNKVLRIGDTIEGARITDINKNGVVVFFGNRKYNLSSPATLNLQSLEKKPQGGEE